MKVRRRHIEMEALDFETGWQPLAGFPQGLEVKILADDLNEAEKTGGRTRLVRFAPGTETATPLTHDYWEEVFLINGRLGMAEGNSAHPGSAPTYSCRPPGTIHGPFVSDTGCILLELQYYAASEPPTT
jgi:ChrR Cupin-like domain